MQEVSTGYGLIEGPVWDAAKGPYFSDVLGGGIRLLDRRDQVSVAVPKRRGVGGMALPPMTSGFCVMRSRSVMVGSGISLSARYGRWGTIAERARVRTCAIRGVRSGAAAARAVGPCPALSKRTGVFRLPLFVLGPD